MYSLQRIFCGNFTRALTFEISALQDVCGGRRPVRPKWLQRLRACVRPDGQWQDLLPLWAPRLAPPAAARYTHTHSLSLSHPLTHTNSLTHSLTHTHTNTQGLVWPPATASYCAASSSCWERLSGCARREWPGSQYLRSISKCTARQSRPSCAAAPSHFAPVRTSI